MTVLLPVIVSQRQVRITIQRIWDLRHGSKYALQTAIKRNCGKSISYIKLFTLYQPVKPQGGTEVQLYSLFNLGARKERPINATPWPFYSREREPVPISQESGWAPGPVWMCASTGIRYPDRPARRESLYRLSYPGLPCNM